MAAFDDYGARAHLHDLARGGFHVSYILDGQPGENFGFGNIWGDDGGALQEFRGDKFDSGGIEKFGAARRLHHRVMDDVCELVGIEEFGNYHRVASIAEHSNFYGSDVAILRQGFELRAQFRAGRVVNGFNGERVLDGERGDGCNTIAAVRRESFQIGGRACAAAGIESRDGQQDGRRWMAMSVRGHQSLLAPTMKIAGRVEKTDRQLRMYAC